MNGERRISKLPVPLQQKITWQRRFSFCRRQHAAGVGPAIVKKRYIRSHKPMPSLLLDKCVGLGNGEVDGFSNCVSRVRSLRITVIQRRESDHRDRMHARDPLDVAMSILQRNLTCIDERYRRRSVTQCHRTNRALGLQPMVTEWASMLGAQFECYDSGRILGIGSIKRRSCDWKSRIRWQKACRKS